MRSHLLRKKFEQQSHGKNRVVLLDRMEFPLFCCRPVKMQSPLG